ncbi:aldo/keto reductase [Acuticoccus sp. M5D2P5]|uniref:aldo/keto reductase n=1 Tax=Acuticoccus kalidii TaxID=2910977 RepID=UPI001F452B74|nr:aldo/keto reductase [Acuticoccus kalidii]MCF3932516.1 aldo/keto reductase [Acuticoccus kalidii]
MTPIETCALAPGLDITRVLTGLWQVADMEKDGTPLDLDAAADHLDAYAKAGFTTFDMADHYGSAELIAGRVLARHGKGARPLAFTKWCPEPGPMTPAIVRDGVEERCRRLGVERVDLLQFHWWTFEHPAWLDALHEMKALAEEGLIGAIGVTNFDAAHLALAIADGIPVVSNQVSFSLLDRRAAGPLAQVAAERGVKLLAYGTLAGGFLSERWLGTAEPETIGDWSGMKYRRFIEAAGGWRAYQGILSAAAEIARKHGVSISNVATRWVLEHPFVGGVIIGARLGERDHRDDNRRLFAFALDGEDHARLAAAFAATRPIPGDCGDEYRRPPYLTASGDLSHHLSQVPSVFTAEPMAARPERARVGSGSEWEAIAGYSRAVKVGERVLVSGTTATHGSDRVVAPGDAGAQTTYILDKILGAIRALGAAPEDVVRTRCYLADPADVEAVSRAHGAVFGAIRPANTLFAAGALIGDYAVEIEAEAVIRAD